MASMRKSVALSFVASAWATLVFPRARKATKYDQNRRSNGALRYLGFGAFDTRQSSLEIHCVLYEFMP